MFCTFLVELQTARISSLLKTRCLINSCTKAYRPGFSSPVFNLTRPDCQNALSMVWPIYTEKEPTYQPFLEEIIAQLLKNLYLLNVSPCIQWMRPQHQRRAKRSHPIKMTRSKCYSLQLACFKCFGFIKYLTASLWV